MNLWGIILMRKYSHRHITGLRISEDKAWHRLRTVCNKYRFQKSHTHQLWDGPSLYTLPSAIQQPIWISENGYLIKRRTGLAENAITYVSGNRLIVSAIFLCFFIHMHRQSQMLDNIVTCCSCCCYVTSVMSDSVRPHRRQPIRLHHPWDSPGKSTGVGCHFLLQCMKVKSESEVTQSCLTLSDPMDCSLPGSLPAYHPWDFPGKSTGVGYHCLLQYSHPVGL